MKTSNPIRIVLADDHEIFRDGFKAMLKKQPSVELLGEASDGEELVSLVRELKPDVVVTDIKMPKMDGLHVLEEIKSDPNLKNIPVVVVSGNIHDGDIKRAYELQASSFLMKPLEVDEYFAAIRSLKELWFHAASPSPDPDSPS